MLPVSCNVFESERGKVCGGFSQCKLHALTENGTLAEWWGAEGYAN